jgi:hypothetical protein
MKVASGLGFLLLVSVWSRPAQSQPWFNLTNSPLPGPPVTGALGTSGLGATAVLDTCVLLTDATVMCHEYLSNHWHRLTPDINGSYRNGTWDHTGIADMPAGNDPSFGCSGCTYAPLYYATAVLKDGRVFVLGGEDVNAPNGSMAETNIGFLFDPVAPGTNGLGKWSGQLNEVFGGGNQGDNSSVVLEDGTLLLAEVGGKQFPTTTNMERFDEATLSFTALNPAGKLDGNAEEGWTILANNTVLTVDAELTSSFEIYNPATNTWGNSGSTVVNLASNTVQSDGFAPLEVGPGLVRPDGKLVYFTGNLLGENAIYDTNANAWSNTQTMNFPTTSTPALPAFTNCPAFPAQTNVSFGVKDGPAALLPNGDVLVMASPVVNSSCQFPGPSKFFEMRFSDNTLVAAPADAPDAANVASFEGRMLLLPTGEVLLTDVGGGIFLWSNGEVPQSAWQPVVTSFTPTQITPGNTYAISGTLFNGFSQGSFYGDDAQTASNYPLVRITSTGTGHRTYARTHDHSRLGVEALGSTEVVTTQFDTPSTLEAGPCTVQVVANGIASAPLSISCGVLFPTIGDAVQATTGFASVNPPSFIDSYKSCNGPYGGNNVSSDGNVQAGKTITVNHGATIHGSVIPNSPVPPTPFPQPAGLVSKGDLNPSNQVVLAAGDYLYRNININTGGSIVGTGGLVRIWYTGNLNINGPVTAANKLPENLWFFGEQGSGSVNINANVDVFGVIFSPTAPSVSLNPAGAAIFGALIGGGQATVNAGAVHFDQVLAGATCP